MDRASSKHGARLDDELKREVLGHLQGSPADGRVEEWREPEPVGEGEPQISLVPHPDPLPAGDPPLAMSDQDRQLRSRLGTYLRRSIFPADREALIAAARTANAPDGVIGELARLPPGQRFPTVARVWAALGHPLDQRF